MQVCRVNHTLLVVVPTCVPGGASYLPACLCVEGPHTGGASHLPANAAVISFLGWKGDSFHFWAGKARHQQKGRAPAIYLVQADSLSMCAFPVLHLHPVLPGALYAVCMHPVFLCARMCPLLLFWHVCVCVCVGGWCPSGYSLIFVCAFLYAHCNPPGLCPAEGWHG